MTEIALLGFPGMIGSSIGLPVEIFQAADDFSRTRRRFRERPPLSIRLLSPAGRPVLAVGGLKFTPDGSFADLGQPQVLFIPSLWRNPHRILRPHLRQLAPLLCTLQRAGGALCAAGNGSFLLAESGLLDERPASTHWHCQKEFARRYPRVLLQERNLITQSGNVYCAGSVNSIADLAVHLVSKLYGPATSRYVEGHFSPEIRRPFAEHAYLHGEGHTHDDEEIIRVQEWMQQHLEQAQNLGVLAARFGLHPRTLLRRFRGAVGESPGRWLRTQRMKRAQDLLRTSNLSIAEIAARCGYPDAAHFSLLFRRCLGDTPRNYRRRVRGKLFSLSAGETAVRTSGAERAPA